MTIKEYLPITLTAERTAESTLRPKTGSEVLFKTTRMDFADLYRSIQRITPAKWPGRPCWMWWKPITAFMPFWKSGRHPAGSVAGKPPRTIRPDDACAMLQPVFEGVAAMHKIGLVHRGICPENIRVMENNRCVWQAMPRWAAHGGQRPARTAVRRLFRPGAVFHRRVRGPLYR